MTTLFLSINAERARDGAGKFVAAGKKVERGAIQASARVNVLDSSLRNVGRTALNLRGGLTQLAGTFVAVAAVRGGIRTIATFEETMLTLQGVAVDTNQTLAEQALQFDRLEDAARRAGASTRFSASEAAEGLLFLGRAGFDANEAVAALPDTLNLAVAGVLELGQAADIASNVVKQFGLEITETTRVADVLVRTANASNTNVEQLAEALKLAGPIAAQAGRSLEETTRAIGILGDAGIQASLAGTNLRGTLLGLAAPTSKARKAIRDMRLDVEQLNPATNDLEAIFRNLAKGLDGIAAPDRLGALNAIFGRRNAAAAAVLAGSVERLGEKFNETGRSAAELAELQDSGLIGSFKAMISAVQEGLHVLGRDKGFGRALQDVIDQTTDVVRVLVGMDDAVEGNIVRARTLATTVKAVTAGFIAMKATRIAIFFGGVAKSVLGVVTSLKALRIALASTGIGLLAVAVGAAAVAAIKFQDELREMGVTTRGVADVVLATFRVLGDRVRLIFGVLARVFQGTFQFFADIAKDAVSLALEAFNSFGEKASSVLSQLFGAIGIDAIKRFANIAIGIFVSLGESIQSLIGGIVEAFLALGEFDITSPIESAKKVVGGLKKVGIGTADDIGAAFKRNLSTDFVSDIGGAVKDVSTDFVSDIGGAVKDVFKSVKAELESELGRDLPGLGELLDVGSISDEIVEAIARLRGRRQELQQPFIDALGDLPAKIAQTTALSAFGIVAKDLETASEEGNRFKDVLDRIASGEGDGGDGPVQRLRRSFEGTTRAMREAIAVAERFRLKQQEIQQFSDNVGRSFANAFGEFVTGAASGRDAAQALLKRLTELVLEMLVLGPLARALSASLSQALAPPLPAQAQAGATAASTGAGLLTNVVGGLFGGGIPGFLSGGQFNVGGSGGHDSQLVAFRATPNERVTVETPGQQRSSPFGGGASNVTVNNFIQTPDLDGFRATERQRTQDVKDAMGGLR
ncbi:MAG: phage tail tape measure protein [bacterium]|nr:phage tail tape measure protein [bacterium]